MIQCENNECQEYQRNRRFKRINQKIIYFSCIHSLLNNTNFTTLYLISLNTVITSEEQYQETSRKKIRYWID